VANGVKSVRFVYADARKVSRYMGSRRPYVVNETRFAPSQVQFLVRSYGFCGRQCGTGAGFLRLLRFPLPILLQQLFHVPSFILPPTLYSLHIESVFKQPGLEKLAICSNKLLCLVPNVCICGCLFTTSSLDVSLSGEYLAR
jgi:hypothetical protein